MFDPGQRPAIATSPISVILLAQALSTEIADTIRGWRTYLETLRRPYEVLLIQETRPEVSAETDEVPETAKPTRIFAYKRSVGIRDVLNDAIRSAQHPLLVFCTCDKQYQPADLELMLKVIDKVDLVVGYRAGGQAPPWRVLLDTFTGVFSRIVLGVPLEPRGCWLGSAGRGRRWIARWVFGVRVHDPECPFRMVRRTIFERLPIQAGGSFVYVEMLAKANHLSCYLAEEPVAWTPPALPASDAVSFGDDAWRIFRDPDFSTPPPPTPGIDDQPRLPTEPCADVPAK